MTRTISLQDLQTQFNVAPGDDIIIENAGQQVARIATPPAVTSTESGTRPLGILQGQIWIAPDFDDELPPEFWSPPDDPLTR